MTDAIGGMGISFSIEDVGSPGTYNAIADVIDCDWPALAKIMAEVTAHDSPAGYKEHVDSGTRELTTFDLTLGWKASASTHAEILAAFVLTTPTNYQIESPDASENIEFDAHIQQMQRASLKDSYYQMVVSFQPTGQPTIT